MGSSEKDLSDGVKHIAMTHFLQENEEKSPDLFIRNSQRELWNEILSYIEITYSSHAIITGNPGIGKSRSMAYFLRLLLQKGKTVIYETRKDKIAFIFIPQEDGKYKVWGAGLEGFSHYNCASLKDPKNYYLIDLTKDNEKIVQVPAHTIVSASPRVYFNLKDFKERESTIQFIMPIWKKEEIKVLCQFIPVNEKNLTDEEFQDRYTFFGGRIRYIFSSKPEYYTKGIKDSIYSLTLDQLRNIIKNPLIKPSFNIETGPSMIFVYDEKETNKNSKYKYEMVEQNYTVKLGSESITQYIIFSYWEHLKEFLNPSGLYYKSNPLFCGHIF